MDEDSRKGSILIVDDTLPTIDLIRTVLEGQGYDVMVATSGEKAIQRVGLKAPDLILLDVFIPGMDGYETCRRLKAEKSTRDIPVVFMIAQGATENKVKGFEVGAVDYVTKPIEVEEVLARVRTHLSLRNMRQKLRTRNERLQQEIAERKRVQDVFRSSEERYRTLVESTSDAILVLDSERRVLSCNQAFQDLFGYGWSEVEGQSIRIIHRSDESFRAFGDKIYPVIMAVGTCRTEWDFVHKDGTLFPVETVTSAMKSSNGSVKGYVAIIRDITERKRAEEALRGQSNFLRQLLDAIPIPIVYKNRQQIYLSCNTAFLKFYGLSKEQVLGKTVHEVFPQDLAEVYYQADSELFRKPGEQVYESEAQLADGSRHDIIQYKATYLDMDGQTAGLISAFLDITERKRAQQEREKLILELQKTVNEVKTLRGILPICAACKKIRDDRGYWNQIEAYVRDHSEAQFSHSICPECIKKLYPDFVK